MQYNSHYNNSLQWGWNENKNIFSGLQFSLLKYTVHIDISLHSQESPRNTVSQGKMHCLFVQISLRAAKITATVGTAGG